ncbi:hypothetical protein ACOSP7_009757 [Xanthoceras sorbifolium]
MRILRWRLTILLRPDLMNERTDNRGGFGYVNLKPGVGGPSNAKPWNNGTVVPKPCATDKLAISSGGVVNEKVGFKYVGISATNAGKSEGSRFDVLKDLEDVDKEEGDIQKGKGKSTSAKQKGVLAEVTNLKTTTSNSKKPSKANVSSKLGDSGCAQKKTGGSANKGLTTFRL